MSDYFQLLRRDLTGSLPAPQWPAGVQLDHYRDDLAPAIHAVLCLTQDQGGGRVPNLETWQHQFTTDAEFDPTLCLVVSNDDGILGVAQCWTSAFIKNLSIHPCAQGQGLGVPCCCTASRCSSNAVSPMWTSRCWRAMGVLASCMKARG